MAARSFDVIVFGATGFTGRQAVTAMVHRAALATDSLGRRRTRP